MEGAEVAMDYTVWSDMELAYELQLQEALAASRGQDLAENEVAAAGEEVGRRASVVPDWENDELNRMVTEALDSKRAAEAAEEGISNLKQYLHDRKVAEKISNMPDEEWEEEGDDYAEPFEEASSSNTEEADVFKLFFHGTVVDNRFAGFGWVLFSSSGEVLWSQSKYAGENISVRVADYLALIDGLAWVRDIGIKVVSAHACSELVCNQVSGLWNVVFPDLRVRWEQVMEHVRELERFEMVRVHRADNAVAFRLAREGAEAGRLQEMSETAEARDSGVASTSTSGVKSESCEICLEGKSLSEMFLVQGCDHSFCEKCMRQHAGIQVQENQIPVRCPHVKCTKALATDECRVLLSPNKFEKLRMRLAEAEIPDAERIYCPYPNCSLLMSRREVDVSGQASSSSGAGAQPPGKLECRSCSRWFCADCKVPWHSRMSCAEYQALPPDLKQAEDTKLYELAKNLKWQPCAKCNRMIELAEGCFHLTCLCGHEFCYKCGAPWLNGKQTCSCELWDERHILQPPDGFVPGLLGLGRFMPVPAREGRYMPPGDIYVPRREGPDRFWDESDEEDEEEGRREFNLFAERMNARNAMVGAGYRTQICRYWRRGYCRNGYHCRFAHGPDQLRR